MGRLASLHSLLSNDISVSTRFAVPRFPQTAQVRNEVGVKSFYGDRLVQLFDVPGTDDQIGVIDKLFPHSRYDSMLLAANEQARTSSADLAAKSLSTIFQIAHSFIQYVSRPDVTESFGLDGAEVHTCFNYDRDTIDRENAMFYDKRFHLHLNCWPGSDLDGIQRVDYGSVTDPLARVRLIDPIAFIAPRIIRDLAGPRVAGYELLAEQNDVPGAPVGLKVRLPGWQAFNDPALTELLRSLHQTAQQAYDAIKTAFVGTTAVPQPWTRPRLLPRPAIRAGLDSINWLSDESRAALHDLAGLLRDVPDESMAALRTDPVAGALRLTLAGLDYSIGFYSPRPHTRQQPLIDAPEIFMVMQCRLFGDVGGAGLPPLRGLSAVRLDRRSGPVLTEAEVEQRTAFRDRFVEQELAKVVADDRLRPVELGR